MQSLGYLFIATFGLNILVGWTGQISLGHAGLFAIGAYTSALASTRLGLPFWLSGRLAWQSPAYSAARWQFLHYVRVAPTSLW